MFKVSTQLGADKMPFDSEELLSKHKEIEDEVMQTLFNSCESLVVSKKTMELKAELQ